MSTIVDEQVENAAEDSGSEDGIKGLEEIPSMCMQCGGSGITRMLMHKIPHFREVIIASFSCDECDEFNNEVTFGGEIQLQGSVITLHVVNKSDLNRQIVKSDSASLKILEIDFEIPANTQKGGVSTIEGFLKTAANNLNVHQVDRMLQMPEVAIKVGQIINQLEEMASGALLPFTMVLDDCAGNSFIENPLAPLKDAQLSIRHYYRTPDQDILLGLPPNKGLYKDDKESNYTGLMKGEFGRVHKEEGGGVEDAPTGTSEEKKEEKVASAPAVVPVGAVLETEESAQLGKHEAVSVPSYCPNCSYLGELLTCITEIPHFKEVSIYSAIVM